MGSLLAPGASGHLSYVCFSPRRHAKWSRESVHCLRWPGEFLYSVEEGVTEIGTKGRLDLMLSNYTHLEVHFVLVKLSRRIIVSPDETARHSLY